MTIVRTRAPWCAPVGRAARAPTAVVPGASGVVSGLPANTPSAAAPSAPPPPPAADRDPDPRDPRMESVVSPIPGVGPAEGVMGIVGLLGVVETGGVVTGVVIGACVGVVGVAVGVAGVAGVAGAEGGVAPLPS